MALLADLLPAVKGRPAVIMGGAPSLPDDVEKVKGDAIWFSANQHGAMLRQCDYIVYVDPVHQVTRERMQDKLSAFGVPTISPCFGADYRVPNWNAAGFRGNCGMQSIWFASMLGANPIIVCGMECYRGGVYWHDAEAKSSSKGRPEKFFDARIADLKRLVDGANIRAVTPSMQKHFPAYDPAEEVSPSAAALAVSEQEIEVRFRRSTVIAKTRFGAGSKAMLTQFECERWRRYVQ